MQFDYEQVEGGIKIIATINARFCLDEPSPFIVWDGVVMPVKRIGPDIIQVGNVLIHRSVLEPGGVSVLKIGEVLR